MKKYLFNLIGSTNACILMKIVFCHISHKFDLWKPSIKRHDEISIMKNNKKTISHVYEK